MADPEVVDESKGKKGQEAAPAAAEGDKKDAPKKAAAPAIQINPMLIVGVVAIVVAILAAFFLVQTLTPKKPPEEKPAHGEEKKEGDKKEGEQVKGTKEAGEKKEAKAGEHKTEKKAAKKAGGHGGGHGEGGAAPSPFYNFGKSLVVNLAETGGEKYLKVDLVFNMDSPELSAEMEEKKPILMDTVLTILSNKTFSDINSNVGKNMLRQEIIDKVNAQLETGRIINIYFNDFVVQ